MNSSSEERQSLESMARKYTSPYCDVIRAKIILLADEGLSNDVIAAQLERSRQIQQVAASDSLSLDCRALRRCLEAGVKPAFRAGLVVPITVNGSRCDYDP